MGFFDALRTDGEYMSSEAIKKYEAIFAKATDEKLQEWWDEKSYDPDVDQRIIDVAEKELRKRHLI